MQLLSSLLQSDLTILDGYRQISLVSRGLGASGLCVVWLAL